MSEAQIAKKVIKRNYGYYCTILAYILFLVGFILEFFSSAPMYLNIGMWTQVVTGLVVFYRLKDYKVLTSHRLLLIRMLCISLVYGFYGALLSYTYPRSILLDKTLSFGAGALLVISLCIFVYFWLWKSVNLCIGLTMLMRHHSVTSLNLFKFVRSSAKNEIVEHNATETNKGNHNDNFQSNEVKLCNEAFKYDGKLGKLSKIWFKNLFLNILTLGGYRFWGKTKLRQYLISCHSLGGARFIYTGTPNEIFFGTLRAIPYLLIVMAFGLIDSIYHNYLTFLSLFCCYSYLRSLFSYRRLQYISARIKWGGISGVLQGSYLEFIKQLRVYQIVTFLLSSPGIAMSYQEYFMKNYSFGGMQGKYKHKPHNMLLLWVCAIIFFIPTLGYMSAVYRRRLNEHLYNNSAIGGVKFKYTATAGQIYRIQMLSLLLIVFSLGLATPIVIHKRNKFDSKVISFTGVVNIEQLKQTRARVNEKLDADVPLVGDGVDLSFG